MDAEKTVWTLTFELLGQSTTSLYFKPERAGETAFLASRFWPTLARFPGTWGIFSSPGDSKLTRDGLGLQWNGHSNTFWTLTFDLLGRNRAPLHFRTESLSEIALRVWWFWPTSARLPGTWGIFFSPGDSKLIPDGLVLRWNWHRKTFWTLTLKLLGRNIAPFYFKTERVA